MNQNTSNSPDVRAPAENRPGSTPMPPKDSGSLVSRLLDAPWIASEAILPLCMGVGLIARLALVILLDVAPSSDAEWYFSRASELALGMGYQEGGYPTAFWPIGYPAFLAALFALFEPSVRVGQLANVALWAISLWLLHATVRRATGELRAANLSVLLYSIYLNALGNTGLLLTETLFVAMLMGAWRLSLELETGRWRIALGLGILLGMMTLVKPQTWLFVLMWAAIVVVFARGDRYRHALRLGAVVIVMFATVLPWSLRNLHVFGSFVLVSTNGGISLAASNHANGTGTDAWLSHPDRAYIAQSVKDQVGADRRAREVTWRWIGENPGDFLALAPRKFWWALAKDGDSEWGYQAGYADYERYRLAFRTVRWINQIVYVFLLGLAAWTVAYFLLRRWRLVRAEILPLGLFAGYLGMFVAVTFVFNGQPRYHFPLMPMICGIGAWALVLYRARERGQN